MTKWNLSEIRQLADFNPQEVKPKDKLAKKVPMNCLRAFERKIQGLEYCQYVSGPKFRNGDTLVAKITPCLENGKTAFVDILDDHEVAFGSTEFVVLRPKNGTNPLFLYYLARSPAFRKKAINCMEGTSGRKRVNEGALKLQTLPVPDPDSQKRIANILDALDTKIELNNQVNTELEAITKLLYDYWFLQFDFPDEYGKPYKASKGEMAYNERLKRLIPAEWDDGTLEDLGRVVGGSTPSTSEEGNFTKDGIAWITPNDLSDNHGNKFISKGAIDVSAQGMRNASLKLYPRGTVLLSSRAPIGYMAIARNDLTTNQGFKSFIPDKGYPTEFIYYCVLRSMKTIVKYASGSTFKEISGGTLKTVRIALPPKDLAHQFANQVSSIFNRQELLEQENQELAKLRDWLLPLLMNGQVKVA